jgi:CDP-paratose 2-epimerase
MKIIVTGSAVYRLAIARIDGVAGNVYNIGGGPANAVSVTEVLQRLERLSGKQVHAIQGPWRPGGQRIFVADTTRIACDLGWQPRTTVETGIPAVVEWVPQSLDEIERVVADAGQLTSA